MSKNPLNFVQTYFLTKQDLENAKFSCIFFISFAKSAVSISSETHIHTFQISDSLNKYL